MITHDVDEFWRVHVDSHAWEQVLHLGRKKESKHGEVIINAGELVQELCYLQSGIVRMQRTAWDGSEKIIMHNRTRYSARLRSSLIDLYAAIFPAIKMLQCISFRVKQWKKCSRSIRKLQKILFGRSLKKLAYSAISLLH